jgi:transcriptional regulator with XRE-family HTH domain
MIVMGRKDKPTSNELSDGALLRKARQAKGVTLTSMAKFTFYSKGHLSNIENGKAHVTLEILKIYESTLKVKIDNHR